MLHWGGVGLWHCWVIQFAAVVSWKHSALARGASDLWMPQQGQAWMCAHSTVGTCQRGLGHKVQKDLWSMTSSTTYTKLVGKSCQINITQAKGLVMESSNRIPKILILAKWGICHLLHLQTIFVSAKWSIQMPTSVWSFSKMPRPQDIFTVTHVQLCTLISTYLSKNFPFISLRSGCGILVTCFVCAKLGTMQGAVFASGTAWSSGGWGRGQHGLLKLGYTKLILLVNTKIDNNIGLIGHNPG